MKKKIAKGFTLIELMIVVAIIGILAAIAIPNFIKYQLRSKFSEASSNIEGLRKAEEALRQGERKIVYPVGVLDANYTPGQYWNLATLASHLAIPGTSKKEWDVPGSKDAARAIDWQVEGATYFQYQTAVGCPPASGATSESGNCFATGALSDIDGNGAPYIGNVALSRPSLPDPGNPTGTPVAPPIGAFPGILADGSQCYDSSATPQIVYGMPCTVTGPDVF